MARVQGGGHSDLMTGNLSGTCFRGYRGNNIVSGSRRMTVAKPKMKMIESPLELKMLVARYSADKLVEFNVPSAIILSGEAEAAIEIPEGENGILQYPKVYSWGDQVGRVGTISQAGEAPRPLFYTADFDRNNQPYIESDGSNDMLTGQVMGSAISMPFEVWMVADEPTIRAVSTYIMRISDAGLGGIRQYTSVTNPYSLYMSTDYYGAASGDGKVKIWRCIFNSGASSIEWNGLRQKIPGNVGAGQFKQMRLFGYSTSSSNCRLKIFEIDIFEGNLIPTDAALMQVWLRDRYNLPG